MQMEKKKVVADLYLKKTDLKTKVRGRDKERHYIMVKEQSNKSV